MPATYRLDLSRRLVWSRAWGILRDDELAAHSRTLRADPQFAPEFSQIQDLTAVERFELTPAGLQIVAWLNPFGPGARRAVVGPTDVGFGLARMHQGMRGDNGDELNVFRDIPAALRWLELPADWTPPPPGPQDPLFESSGP